MLTVRAELINPSGLCNCRRGPGAHVLVGPWDSEAFHYALQQFAKHFRSGLTMGSAPVVRGGETAGGFPTRPPRRWYATGGRLSADCRHHHKVTGTTMPRSAPSFTHASVSGGHSPSVGSCPWSGTGICSSATSRALVLTVVSGSKPKWRKLR